MTRYQPSAHRKALDRAHFYALGQRVRITATCPKGVTLPLIHEVRK